MVWSMQLSVKSSAELCQSWKGEVRTVAVCIMESRCRLEQPKDACLQQLDAFGCGLFDVVMIEQA